MVSTAIPARTPDADFQTALAHARLEALTVLRRAMTDADNPPSKEAIRAAITILRLPKHLTTTTPCHAGDEPPSSLSSSFSESPATPEGRCEAHPRVSHPSPRGVGSGGQPMTTPSPEAPSTDSAHQHRHARKEPPHTSSPASTHHDSQPTSPHPPIFNADLTPSPIITLLSRAGQAPPTRNHPPPFSKAS